VHLAFRDWRASFPEHDLLFFRRLTTSGLNGEEEKKKGNKKEKTEVFLEIVNSWALNSPSLLILEGEEGKEEGESFIMS